MMSFEHEYEIRIKNLKSQFLACKQWELYSVDNDIEPATASARLEAMQDDYAKNLTALQAFVASNFSRFDARNVSSLIAVPTQQLDDDEKIMHRIWLGSHPTPLVKESIRQWGCAIDDVRREGEAGFRLVLWVWDKRQLQDDPCFRSARDAGGDPVRYTVGHYTVGTQRLAVNSLRDLAEDFAEANVDLVEKLYAQRHFVNLSDIFRLVILREFGGVYLDADTMPYRTATIFLSKPEVPDYIYYQADRRSGKIHQCHVSWMNLHKDENGVLIARKGNPAIRKMTAQINENLLKVNPAAADGSYYSVRSRDYAMALHASTLHDATYGVWQQYIGRTFLSYDDITRANSILHDGRKEGVCGGLRGMRLVADWVTNERVPLDSEEQRAYEKCIAELERRDWRLEDPRELEKIGDLLFIDEVPRMAYAPQLRTPAPFENCSYYSFLSNDRYLDRVNSLFSEYLMKRNADRIAAGNFWYRTREQAVEEAARSPASAQPTCASMIIDRFAATRRPAAPEKGGRVGFVPGYLLEDSYKDRMAKLLFSTSYLEYCSFDNKLKLPLAALQRRQNIDPYISFTHGMFDAQQSFIGFFTAATMEEFAQVPTVSHYRDEVRPMDEAYERFVAGHTRADDLFVSSLAVDDAQRGKGYFNAMLEKITSLARCKGSRRIVLTVWGKSDAFQIYVKKGFRVRSTFDYAWQKFFDYLYLMEYDVLPEQDIDPVPARPPQHGTQPLLKAVRLQDAAYAAIAAGSRKTWQ